MMKDAHAIGKRLERFVWADPNVVRYAVRITVCGRWFILLVNVFQLAYRPNLWYPDDIEHVVLQAPLAIFNGLVHYRLFTNRPVSWRWMLALGAIDIVLITAHAVIRGGFDITCS